MASSSAANRDDSPEDSSSPENSEFDRNFLPARLFATDRYPVSGRINSYSKPEYLLDLVEVLAGTPELEWLKSSCFGALFRLPVRRSSISGKLVHQFLCRSLVTDKLHEIWFVFGGRPIRFSLREFAILTGLNCGDYPSRQAFLKMITPVKKGVYFLNKLIGPNNTYTIPEVISILREDKDVDEAEKMDSDRRKRLALVVIVDGILACDTSKVVATVQTSEMLKDLEAFMQYPWGRKSFELTLEMVKVGKKNRNVNVLAEKLSQSHTATHGFTISFQLLILQAVPLLQQFLPELDPNATFSDRPVSHLTICKTFHNSNILQVERDPNLHVESILHTEDPEDFPNYSWVDEAEDDSFDYIVNNLKDGHKFNKEDWHGGFDDLPLLSLPVKAKGKKAPSKRVEKSVFQKHCQSKFDGPNIQEDIPSTSEVDGVKAEELLREVDRRNNEHTAKIQQMIKQMVAVERAIEKDEIRDHVLSVLREEGLVKTPVNMNHTDLLNQMNNSTWKDYGEGLPDIFNNITKVIGDPDIGQEANEYLRRLSNDGVSKHGSLVDKNCSSSVSGGNVNTNGEIPTGDADGKQDQVSTPKSHAFKAAGEDAEMVNSAIPDVYTETEKDADMVKSANVEVTEDPELVKSPNTDVYKEPEKDAEMVKTPNMELHTNEDPPDPTTNISHHKPSSQPDKDLAHTEEDKLPENDTENAFDNEESLKIKELSSSSESSPSQTSHTGLNQEEAVSPSSKKRSLIPKESEETPLPTKRPRKKPRRFGVDESSRKKPILPGPSERGGDYAPFPVVKSDKKKKFIATLRAYNQKEYIIDGHSVKSSFFEDIYTPKHWVGSQHMEAMLSLIWKTCGESFSQSRVAVLDTWFTHILCNDHSRFQKERKKSAFPWNNVIKNYVRGIVPGRSSNMAWFTDVDTVYVPMNWGKRHWVACVIYLKEGKIRILDPLIVNNDDRKLPRLMKPLLDMLPFVIKDFVTPASAGCPLPTAFTFERPVDVYQNERCGDCGPLTVKFIELHAQGLPLDEMTDKMVDEMRMSFAVDIYEEFVVSLA